MNDTLRRLLNRAITGDPQPQPRPCFHMIAIGFTDNQKNDHPPTYCDKDAIEGSSYCAEHTPKPDHSRIR